MAAGKQPGGGPAGQPSGQAKKSGWPVLVWTVVVLVVCCGGLVVYPSWGSAFGDDGSDRIPPPTAQERGDTVPILQRSAASQGLCYGWVLADYFSSGDPVSVGSNLGDAVAVEGNPACPRWVQVTASVAYTAESSESNDFARVEVTGSSDIPSADLLRIETGLERFGLTEDVFIDDPGWAVTRAAVMLPLLAAEVELVQPATTPAPAAASPSPLPATASDLWRDRWGYLLAAGGLLLLTALLVTVGLVQRRRQLRAAVPAQRAGAEPAGRTRENA